jgi:hypothetical protein
MQQPIALLPVADHMASVLTQDGLWYAFVDNSAALTPDARATLAECGQVAFVDPRPITLKNTAGLTPEFITPRFQLYRVAAAPPS